MTLASPGAFPAHLADAATANLPESTRRAVVISQPGLLERALVVITAFVMLHGIPNTWFITRAERGTDTSNPLLVVVQLALISVALIRVAGWLDDLVAILRLEGTIFLFSGLLLATTVWSAAPGETVKRAIVFLAVTFYASYLVLRFPLEQIIRLLAMMFVISVAINIAFIVSFPEYGIDAGDRLTGVFPQKNALGYTAVLGVPTLIIAARTFRTGRFVFYGAAALSLGLLFGSESKTMLVAALVPTCLMVVYHGFRGRKTLRGAVIVSLAGSAAFALAFATANIGLLAEWLDKDVTLTGRIPLWENLLPIALERPVVGHGYGATFRGFYSPVHEVWIQNRWNPSHAHNALLQIWLEAGVFAMAVFVVAYARAVSRAIKVVAVVPGAIGLWPLVFLTTTLLVSITESGVSSEYVGWMMFVVATMTVSFQVKHGGRAQTAPSSLSRSTLTG